MTEIKYGGRLGKGGPCQYEYVPVLVNSSAGEIDVTALIDVAAARRDYSKSVTILMTRIEGNYDGRMQIHILDFLSLAAKLPECLWIATQVLWHLARRFEEEYVSRLSTDLSVKDAQGERHQRVEEVVRDMKALKLSADGLMKKSVAPPVQFSNRLCLKYYLSSCKTLEGSVITHCALDAVRAARKDILFTCLFDNTNPQPTDYACWLAPQVQSQ